MKGRLDEPRFVSTTGIAAVVLAGSLNRHKLYEGYEPGYKALLEFGGRPSIEYTLRALHGDPRIGSVCVVGPEAELRGRLEQSMGADGLEFEPGGETIYASLEHGLEHFAGVPAVLVATEDMPLITTQAVTDFLDACERAPLWFPQNILPSFAPKEAFTGPFAEGAKTFNRFRNVSVVHGNMALVEPSVREHVEFAARLNKLYRGRKSWTTQLSAVGLPLALSFAVGSYMLPILSLERMAALVTWRMGIGFQPIVIEHPEICIDVDSPKDYRFVKELLEPPALTVA